MSAVLAWPEPPCPLSPPQPAKRKCPLPRPSSSTSASSAPPATAKLSTPTPSIAPSKRPRQPAAARSFFPPEFISASPSISRATSTCYLDAGATILAAESPKPGETTGYNGGTYDAAEPNTAWDAYQDYGHNHWHNSLIWGEDMHDFSITGPGLIYGKGLSFGAGPGRAPADPACAASASRTARRHTCATSRLPHRQPVPRA